MSSLKLSVALKGYSGNNSNACSNLNFSKTVNLSTIDVEEYKSETVELSATETLTLFSVLTADAKKLLYIETSGACNITINGVAEETIQPIVIGSSVKNGIYLKSGSFETAVLTNNTVDAIIVSYIAIK